MYVPSFSIKWLTVKVTSFQFNSIQTFNKKMGKNHEIGSAVPMHDDTYHVNKTQSMIL